MKSGNFFNYEQSETGFMTYDGFMVLNLTIEIMKVRGKTVFKGPTYSHGKQYQYSLICISYYTKDIMIGCLFDIW